MTNHRNAEKAVRQTIKKTLIRKSRGSEVKTVVKKVLAAIASGDVKLSEQLFITAQKKIDMAVTKGLFKKNTASRKVSSLSQKIKALKQAS
jgi:small subunit ribosomal protein S20